MLENARRQLILVLITIAAGLFCTLTLSPTLGMDLQGGSQLIYEVPEEVLQKVVTRDPATSIDAIMEQTVSVIAERVDPTGTLDATVTRRGPTGVLVELPHMSKSQLDIVKARIASLGKLEMRIVATDDFVLEDVTFNLAEEKKRLEKWLAEGGREQVRENWKKIENFNEDAQNGPLAFGHLKWYPHLVEPKLDNRRIWSGSFAKDTTPFEGVTPMGPSTVAVYDEAEWNGGMVPEAMQQQERPFLLEFVAINMRERSFTGEDLDPGAVQPGLSPDSRLAVDYALKPEFAQDYGNWSEKYLKKHSAIILNGVIRSAPYFVSRIPGRGQISGQFSESEVQELVKVLRTGSLQVEPVLMSGRTVGKTLGDRAVELGALSLVAGAAAVFVFMLWYYRLAGIVACITLVLNVFLLWSAVLFMQATITLPGLGGIVLTMGMAVDANVLIYERIREEAERGKDMLRAVRAGFERAMSAILDANITTFLTGLVLFNVGVGPVRGFAVTLMVGIVTTVFTQFFVTRLLFHYLLQAGKLERFSVRRLFAQPTWNYLAHARKCVIGSLVVIVAGLVYAIGVVPSEESLGIDFKGGANLQMLLQQPTTEEAVRARLQGDAEFTRDFSSFRVNTIEAGPDRRSQSFNVRLKLNDEMRASIERDRAVWREQRRQAEKQGTAPPAPYEPPYLLHLRRIFADTLAQPAYSAPKVTPGPNNVAFAEITLHFQEPVVLAAAQELLRKAKLPRADASVPPGMDDAAVGKDVFVQWTTAPSTNSWELFDTVRDALSELTSASGAPVQLSDPFPEAEEIQGRMVGELRNAAIGALVLSWLLIIFYLRIRFHEYKYGIAAVVALVHDVLVTFAVVVAANHFGLVNAEISLNMIACFLTIIGYSVNDTIVIFDRIRENVREQEQLGGHMGFRDIINLSLNQTMSRTVLTTGVTLFVVLAQLLVNYGTGSDLESFAFGMFVGMVCGTYSTIFIASPVLVWVHDRYQQQRKAAPTAPVAVQS